MRVCARVPLGDGARAHIMLVREKGRQLSLQRLVLLLGLRLLQQLDQLVRLAESLRRRRAHCTLADTLRSPGMRKRGKNNREEGVSWQE